MDADTGSTHAMIAVKRTVVLDNDGASQADALAGFVHIPASVDAGEVLNLLGLALDLPETGRCSERNRNRHGTTPLTPMAAVEFVEAGQVAITAETASTTLAPHAFPTVTDLISGVVYASRDRAAEPLPPEARYLVSASGSLGVSGFDAEGFAPSPLEGVTVDGLPLAELDVVSTRGPIYMTWDVGTPGDLVYVELISFDGSSVVCSFRDETGIGTIPENAFSSPGEGRVSIHRVHVDPFSSADIQTGSLRFDFELSTAVSFE